MKNYKKIFYLVFLSLVVISCGQDEVDSVTNFGELGEIEQVKVRFNDDNTNPTIIEGITSTSFRLGMPSAVDGTVTVEMEVTSNDDGVEATFMDTVVIERGQNEIIYDFASINEGVEEFDEVYTLSIKGIKVDFVNGNTEYFTYSGENNSRTINVVEPTITTTVGDVETVLTWTNVSRNMDLFLVTGNQDFGGTVIDSSLGSRATEAVTMPGSATDGVYSIYINQWAFTANVDYTMTFKFPDGQEKVYSSTVTRDSFVFTQQKITIGSTVYYVINEL